MNTIWIKPLVLSCITSLALVGCGGDSSSSDSGSSASSTSVMNYVATGASSDYDYTITVNSIDDEFINITVVGTSDTVNDFELSSSYMIDASSGLTSETIPAIYTNEDTDTEFQDELTVSLSSSFGSVSIDSNFLPFDITSVSLLKGTSDTDVISTTKFLDASFLAETTIAGTSYTASGINDMFGTDDGTLYVIDYDTACWIEAEVYSGEDSLYSFYGEIIDSNCEYTAGQAGVVIISSDAASYYDDVDYVVTSTFVLDNTIVGATSFLKL